MKKEKLRWFGIPKLFPYLKGYGRLVLVDMVALGFVGSAMDAVIPLFQQYAIDHFIANETLAGLGGFLALYILVMIVQTATNCISAFAACKAEMYIGRDLKRVCFNHLQTLSFSYFNQNSVGYIHARVMSDTDKIATILAWGLMEAVWYVAYLALAIVMMFALNWKLALCVMAIVPVLAISSVYFQKKLVFHHRRVREQNSKITSGFNEGITGAKTTKTLVIEEKLEQEFRGLTRGDEARERAGDAFSEPFHVHNGVRCLGSFGDCPVAGRYPHDARRHAHRHAFGVHELRAGHDGAHPVAGAGIFEPCECAGQH